MNNQPTTEEEYDIELLNAKLELASCSFNSDDVKDEDIITRESFFDDLRRASQRIVNSQSSLKQSKT